MNVVTEVRDNFVQLWGALGPFWGVSPTTARAYGWLLSRPEGADAEEMMKGLEMSRGAVSMACRELREWGLILPEKAPGSRRVVYRPETDLARVTRHVVQIRKRREWDPIRENLREWIPQLEADPSPEAAVFLQRLKAIEALVVIADSMAEIFLKGGTVGSFGLKALLGGRWQARPRSANAERVQMVLDPHLEDDFDPDLDELPDADLAPEPADDLEQEAVLPRRKHA